jgi:DNA-binding NtrC family response regulator
MAKRILVIDDEEAVRKSFILSLEDDGYDVDTAASGEEGIRSIKKNRPDLIFLDLKMPGMNGVDTLREVRKIDKNVPVYIVTAFLKEFLDLLNAAVKQGVKFEILNKPIESQQIRAIVKAALENPAVY